MSVRKSAADAAQLSAIAEAFVAARRSRTALAAYPGLPPTSEDEAYQVQRHAISLWPDQVVGWKVGLIPPPFSQQLGRTRLFGPIFKANVYEVGSETFDFPGIVGGFSAVEAEYLLKIGGTVQPAIGWTAERAASVVSAVYVGVEMAGSPFSGINDHGPLVTISDFGNNACLLVGAEIPGGVSAFEGESCSVTIDGTEIGTGSPAKVPGTPLESVAELLNHMGRTGYTVPAGTLISTGAATGVHRIHPGQTSVADFGPHGQFNIRIVEA